jgi:hypothetical protein
MTQQKALVERYTDGFRRGDLARRLDTFHIWLGEVTA